MVAKTYQKCNYFNKDYYTLVFFKQSDYYLPIIHTENKMFSSSNSEQVILDKIDQNFKLLNNSFINEEFNLDEKEDTVKEQTEDESAQIVTNLDKQLIELDKFWKYNLKQLQELAAKLDIQIKDDSGKNKLKRTLYDEIVTILK